MELYDYPPPVSLLVHVAFPSFGRERLSVCQPCRERPIEDGPRDVTRDGDCEIVWTQAPLREGLLQKVDVQAIPDALPAREPAEWGHRGYILVLQPDLGGECGVRPVNRFEVLLKDLVNVLLLLVDARRAIAGQEKQ